MRPTLAFLGHQTDWAEVAEVVRGFRPAHRKPLPMATIQALTPWIPPRTVSRVRFPARGPVGEVNAVYVETFITPDELTAGRPHAMLAKVRDGILAAAREGVRIATLGGFTSIVVEGRALDLPGAPVLTTGNSLTSALIVHGVVEAARLTAIDLSEATVGIIGASGDIGSACGRWLGRRAKRLLLVARHPGRLDAERDRLRRQGIDADTCTTADEMIPRADVIVAAASTTAPVIGLDRARPHTLICDAGYPKNLICHAHRGRLFHGGMGLMPTVGVSSNGVIERIYRFPAPGVIHGCLLEGLMLAAAERYEPFSGARGSITPERIDEIWRLARSQGAGLAPFFNADGLWPDQ